MQERVSLRRSTPLNVNDNLNDNVLREAPVIGREATLARQEHQLKRKNVNRQLKKKAKRIRDFILMSGNFGHNRDTSYYSKYPFIIRKCISMSRRITDLINHARIFPLDSLRFSFSIMKNGLKSAMRGEG